MNHLVKVKTPKRVYANAGIDRLINDLFDVNYDYQPRYHQKYQRLPKSNIKEVEDTFIIEMAIPGISKKDIDIRIEKDILTVSHKEVKNETDETTKAGVKRLEFDYSNFKRSFKLPKEIDHESISAQGSNGILSITLKKSSNWGPKQIEIK